MALNLDTLSPLDAMHVLCLCLAQNGDPHSDLGFQTQGEAFDQIARRFGSKPNTVKNNRDSFDRFTDSPRVGWDKPLRPALSKIWEAAKGMSRDAIIYLGKEILEREWEMPLMEEEHEQAIDALHGSVHVGLPDLAATIARCKQLIGDLDQTREVFISDENAEALLSAYRLQNPSHSITMVGGHVLVINTGDQTRHVSVQELPKLSVLAEYMSALQHYGDALDRMSEAMGFGGRTTDGSNFWRNLPSKDWRGQVSTTDSARLDQAILSEFSTQVDRDFVHRFISDPDWSGLADEAGNVGRKFNRSTDWQESAILKVGGLVAAASAGRINIIRAISSTNLGSNLTFQNSPVLEAKSRAETAHGGRNQIYYGAPGTGKSYKVNEIVGQANVVRTVFHPDTQNSDFFGCLKPTMVGDRVTYQFAPGPLSRALTAAMRDKEHHHYLVIEELNRAPAAAVFGELFQLLDRDDSGAGEYPVDFPNPESAAWFAAQGVASEKLRMPANLSIIATMNSADQGVYPLDTAFRRRWEQEYLPLYEGDGPQGEVYTHGPEGEEIRLSWKTFLNELNDLLIKLDLAEDRLLGLWFAKERELGEHVPAKILLYLWDDLLRHEGRGHMFASNIKTYGALDLAIKAGKPIFSEGFLTALKAKLPVATIDTVSAPEEIENAEGQ